MCEVIVATERQTLQEEEQWEHEHHTSKGNSGTHPNDAGDCQDGCIV